MPGKSTKTTRLSLRVPNALLARLRKEAERRGISVAAVIFEWLERAERTRRVPGKV
jgi:hypothetical protein